MEVMMTMPMDKSKKERFVIQLTHEKKALLVKMAEEEQRSVSNLINVIIDRYLKSIENELKK